MGLERPAAQAAVPRTTKPSSVASMSAPRPRRPSTTVAIRSDSLTLELLGAGDDRLALGEAAEQRDQRELVDRQRDLVRLDRRADERAGGDVELADRLLGRDPVRRRAPRGRR